MERIWGDQSTGCTLSRKNTRVIFLVAISMELPWLGKSLLHHMTFMCGIHQSMMDYQHKGPVMQIFVDFFVASLNKFWTKFGGLWIDLLRSSQNARVPYPTMQHFVTEICTCVHISVTKCCIVGYLSDALWDICDWSIEIPWCSCSVLTSNKGQSFQIVCTYQLLFFQASNYSFQSVPALIWFYTKQPISNPGFNLKSILDSI